MWFARQILAKFAKVEVTDNRKGRFVDTVRCAYCRGSGVDPKYVNTSGCPVCGASGKVNVTPPVITCLNCRGTGRQGGDLTCLSCGGIGVVSVRAEAVTCPKCKGTGQDGVFYCNHCKGRGIV